MNLFADSPLPHLVMDFSQMKAFLDAKGRGASDCFRDPGRDFSDAAGQVKILAVNRATQRLCGLASDSKTGWRMIEVFGEETVVDLCFALRPMLEGTLDSQTSARPLAWVEEGRKFLVSWSLVPGFERELSRVVVSLQDVTEKTEAEEELRKFKTISDATNVGIAFANSQGSLIYINSAFARVHGFSPEDLAGKTLFAFHSEAQMGRVSALLRKLQEAGQFSMEEVWHTHRNGTAFPMLMNGVALRDENGRVKFMVATAVDLTDFKKAEKAREESEARFRSLVETMSEGLAVLDRDLRITYVNERFGEMVGCPKEELLGKSHLAVTEEGCWPLPECKVSDRRLKKYDRIETVLHTAGGGRLPVILSRNPLFDAEGEFLGTLGVFTDISDRILAEERLKHFNEELEKRVEERVAELAQTNLRLAVEVKERKKAEMEMLRSHNQLRQNQRQMIQTTKMAAIGRLAAGVAHEINNPLAVIVSSVDILQKLAKSDCTDQDTLKEKMNRHARRIQENAFRCKDIIGALLDFSKADAEEPAPVDLRELLLDTCDLLQSGGRLEGRELYFSREPITGHPLPEISPLRPCLTEAVGAPVAFAASVANGPRLQRILLNLLTNAADATSAGGVVALSVQARDGGLELVVADTGEGIRPEDTERLFEPFFTRKAAGRGTGLGLYLCHQMIETLGGTIRLESRRGVGTIAKVWLPGAGSPPAPA